MLRVAGHPPESEIGPPQLDDASNSTGECAAGLLGVTVKFAVGADDRISPIGTRRITTDSEPEVWKFVPVGVATIETHVPGSVPHMPNWPFCGLGGAVYTTVATPLALVTIVRADK